VIAVEWDREQALERCLEAHRRRRRIGRRTTGIAWAVLRRWKLSAPMFMGREAQA
jgi:hypothetical protein